MTVVLEARTYDSILHVDGALRAPLNRELRHSVEALLGRGTRAILLDLSRLSDIDAAGVGELVRVYNTSSAAGSTLGIAQPGARVKRLLDLAGVLSILAAEAQA
jgi:anti-anti-sigma factor